MSEIQNQSNDAAAPAADKQTAFEILKRQDRDTAKKALAARLFINGVKQEEPVDLSYVPKAGETVEPLMPEDGDEALEVYRHSQDTRSMIRSASPVESLTPWHFTARSSSIVMPGSETAGLWYPSTGMEPAAATASP